MEVMLALFFACSGSDCLGVRITKSGQEALLLGLLNLVRFVVQFHVFEHWLLSCGVLKSVAGKRRPRRKAARRTRVERRARVEAVGVEDGRTAGNVLRQESGLCTTSAQ